MSIAPEQLEEKAVDREPEESPPEPPEEELVDRAEQPAPPPEEELVLEDLLVEDVSIDGMCGVY